MKKILLSTLVLGTTMTMFGQGITPRAAFDDFKKADEFSDLYSFETEELQFPCGLDDAAYMGVFTYADKTLSETGNKFSLTQTRNMESGQLELNIYQGKGSYEPFGFIFGSYCGEGSEAKFALDLSGNAMLQFSVEAVEFANGDVSTGTATNGVGLQLKIQAEDANGVSLAFDGTYDEGTPGDFWKYEIGITGDGGQASNFGGKNHFTIADGAIHISYNLKNAIPAGSDDKPDRTKTFDYSKVIAIKLTFASNNKDSDNGYDPYEHTGKYIIRGLKIGDVAGEGIDTEDGLSSKTNLLSATIFPNPAKSNIEFSEELENVVIYNAQGMEVYTAAKAKLVNVSAFESGVYFVQTAKGSKSFIVE